jgi:thioredoxin-dependent peroxiredoxin
VSPSSSLPHDIGETFTLVFTLGARIMSLAVGDTAPDFDAKIHDGSTLRLSSLRGKRVVLYFYPKDDTPGCTVEACDFRDHRPKFSRRKVEVIGVSPDSPERHAKFRDKYELPFTLVSDADKKIATAYGVFKEKNMYGKKVLGIVRTTFLIDAEGKIESIWPGVKVKGHVEAVLESL